MRPREKCWHFGGRKLAGRRPPRVLLLGAGCRVQPAFSARPGGAMVRPADASDQPPPAHPVLLSRCNRITGCRVGRHLGNYPLQPPVASAWPQPRTRFLIITCPGPGGLLLALPDRPGVWQGSCTGFFFAAPKRFFRALTFESAFHVPRVQGSESLCRTRQNSHQRYSCKPVLFTAISIRAHIQRRAKC